METTTLTFRIRNDRKGWFEHEMGKLARRAAKIGVTAPTYAFGPHEDVTETHREEVGEGEDGRAIYTAVTEVVRYWPTTITGEAPKFAGWTLAATIQILDAGPGPDGKPSGERQVLVRSITEIPAPLRFRQADTAGNCEHCKAARRRKDTFLVLHDSGEWKQVGRQCIRDFLGHKSPENIARMAEFLLAAHDLGEGGEFGGGGTVEKKLPLDYFMAFVAAVVGKWGWRSKKRAEEEGKAATASTAMDHAAPSKELLKLQAQGKWERLVPSDADKSRAAEAIDWARALTDAEVEASDYLYNLRTIANVGVIEHRTAGYAASIIIAHDKALDRVKARQALPESNYVGTVGERVVLTLTLKKVIVVENDFGVTHIHLFNDEAGNDFKWFGSKHLRLEWNTPEIAEGETVAVKATIKNHEEYKGRKQTSLSRCAVHVEKPKKNKANNAIAAGVVAFFEGLMEPYLVSQAIVDFITWYKAAHERYHYQIGYAMQSWIEAIHEQVRRYDYAVYRGIVTFFEAARKWPVAVAKLIGDSIACFFVAALMATPEFYQHVGAWDVDREAREYRYHHRFVGEATARYEMGVSY